jgi:hypothetical protein
MRGPPPAVTGGGPRPFRARSTRHVAADRPKPHRGPVIGGSEWGLRARVTMRDPEAPAEVAVYRHVAFTAVPTGPDRRLTLASATPRSRERRAARFEPISPGTRSAGGGSRLLAPTPRCATRGRKARPDMTGGAMRQQGNVRDLCRVLIGTTRRAPSGSRLRRARGSRPPLTRSRAFVLSWEVSRASGPVRLEAV